MKWNVGDRFLSTIDFGYKLYHFLTPSHCPKLKVNRG